MTQLRFHLLTPFVALTSLVSACDTAPNDPEAPAASASIAAPKMEHEAVLPDALIVREVADVAVTTAIDAWSGEPGVKDAVTPVQVRVANGGATPVRVQYEAMSLIAPDGTTYAAIPPFELEGSVEHRTAVVVPEMHPAWQSESFFVTDAYDPLFDDAFEVWKDEVYSDPSHYDYYHGIFASQDLPTAEMLALAMPEGVVDRGGYVQGFVYFEFVPSDLEAVTFSMQLRAAPEGRRFGTIQLPFAMGDGS